MSDDDKDGNSSDKSKYLDFSTPPVGYKNPPKHSQFKKGTSGNPDGSRKKRSENVRDAFLRVSYEKISIKIGGKTKKLPRIMVALRELLRLSVESPSFARLLTNVELEFPIRTSPYDRIGQVTKTEKGAAYTEIIYYDEISELEALKEIFDKYLDIPRDVELED